MAKVEALVDFPQVASKLQNTKPIYEDDMKTHLKGAYDKMNSLRDVWGGNLYNFVQQQWNEQVVYLNKFIIATAESYNMVSEALKNFSTADGQPMNKGTIESFSLGTMLNSDPNKLKTNSSVMEETNKQIVDHLSIAITAIEKIFTNLTTINAQSANLDRLKSEMSQYRHKIVEALTNIQQAINHNIETAAGNYKAAEGSIQ